MKRWRATGTSGGPPRRSPHRPSLVQQLVDAAQADDLDAGGDGRSGEVRRWDDDAVDFQPVRGVCGEFGRVGVDGWNGAVLVHVAEDDGALLGMIPVPEFFLCGRLVERSAGRRMVRLSRPDRAIGYDPVAVRAV